MRAATRESNAVLKALGCTLCNLGSSKTAQLGQEALPLVFDSYGLTMIPPLKPFGGAGTC